MFSLRHLLADKVGLGPELGDEPVDSVVKRLARRKPYRFRPPQVPELRIAHEPGQLRLIEEALAEVLRVHDEVGLRAAREILLDPLRSVGGRAENGVRRYSIFGVVDDGGPGLFIEATICARPAGRGKPAQLEHVDVSLLSAAAADSVRAQLREIYLASEDAEKLVEARGAKRPLRVVWLRAPRDAGVRAGLAQDVAALAATYGYTAEVYLEADANPRQVASRVKEQQARIVLIWEHDQTRGRIGTELGLTPGGASVLPVSGNRAQALTEASLWLDADAEQAPTLPPPTPKDPLEALQRVAETVRHVVIHKQAFRAAADSPFRRPAEVIEAIELVDEIAGLYASNALPSGFTGAFRGRPFNYADDISDTAKNAHSSYYEIEVDGVTRMMGPHLRRGDDHPETGLRIYWWVDAANRRLVVGHVGRHLPDKGSSS